MQKYINELDDITKTLSSEFKRRVSSFPHKNGTIEFTIDYLKLLGEMTERLTERLIKKTNEVIEKQGNGEEHSVVKFSETLQEYCKKNVQKFIEENKP